jgi:filamentous hemagglutinin
MVPVHTPKGVSATFTITQLEKKWKHAADFGITTTKRNPTTLAQYERAIVGHLDDVATIEKGTYLYVKNSKVFFNPNTNLVVVLDKDGLFVTGWKLTPGTPQWTKLINDGVLR